MVERENVGHDSQADEPEEPQPMLPAQETQASLSPVPGSIPANERPIGRYDYEGGAYVRIAASGDIDTEEALDMVETLIRLKRAELSRKHKRANPGLSAITAAVEHELTEQS